MSKSWNPDIWSGGYKLAPSIARRVFVLLQGLKNKDAAHRLFVFLARFNASPKRINAPFPIDRRALSLREDLGLTENEVRGAITALRENGIIEVIPDPLGNRYHRVGKGVNRIALQYRFSFALLRIFRYIISRFPSSPRDRRDSKLEIDSTRKAPLLGDLKRAETKSRAPEPVQLVLKPIRSAVTAKISLRAPVAHEPGNPLHEALQRMQGLLRGRKAVEAAT